MRRRRCDVRRSLIDLPGSTDWEADRLCRATYTASTAAAAARSRPRSTASRSLTPTATRDRDYIVRKRAEGKTACEAIRCLKHHLARRIWHLLQPVGPHPNQTLSLHRLREWNRTRSGRIRALVYPASRRKEQSACTVGRLSQPPRFQTQFRVTKYDPALRDQRGGFAGDDWTSVGDVGNSFGGEVLSLHRYLEVESHHLQVVAAFLAEAEAEHTVVRGPERYEARWWPAEGDRLTRLESVDVVREMLRERGLRTRPAPLLLSLLWSSD